MDPSFLHVDNLKPIVSTYSNFDSLRIGSDHVSRSKSDTYYLTNDTVLRTHTSAHQNDLLTQGHNCFLVSGDVYRCVCVFACYVSILYFSHPHMDIYIDIDIFMLASF